MAISDELKKVALKIAYKYLDKDPEANLPKLMDWVDKFVNEDVLVVQRNLFRKIVKDSNSNWYKLVVSLWDDIDDEVRKTLFENLVINANALATIQARESKQSYRCNIPWALVLDTTQTADEPGMDFDCLDDIIEQAKELGTFMFIFVGKSIYDRKEELIALCNKHSECEFMGFTGNYDVDDDLIIQLKRVKNYIPAILLKGTEADEEVHSTMAKLHEAKLPYGAYVLYDESNMVNFNQEGFYDKVIDWGAKFCFFFSSLDEDNDVVYPVIKELRESKSLLTINFCKDKEIIGGCVAGGKYYCFINAKGDVEPCVFLHKSDSNIHDGTLLEAYKGPLFMEYLDEAPVCTATKRAL